MSIRIVALRAVDGLAVSTANIYFTSHDSAGGHVFRTAQSATPGQEAELCNDHDSRFGDIVFAKVDGVFYGYFFALAGGATTIRRIPLAPQPGQTADVIGPPIMDIDIVASVGNLVTDGSFLYWQSDTAINKMPIRGGAVTVLDASRLTRPTSGIHLVGPNLIYAVDRTLHYVPTDGSAISPPVLRVITTAATGVVACAPLVGSIYWVDRNGAVVWHAADGTGQVKQAPGHAYATSMAYDGTHLRLAWTQMAATWELRVDAGANDYTFTTGSNPRLVMFNAEGDIFWGDDEGLRVGHL